MSLALPLSGVDDVARRAEYWTAQEILEWALDRFHPRIAFASSFGVEDVAVLHMLSRLDKDARVFTLDTGRLPAETYDVMERIREAYGTRIEVYVPQRQAIEALQNERGFFSFRKSVEERKLCCGIRKVEPLNRALSTLDAWSTGLRREQAVTRTVLPAVEIDHVHGGIVKVNPLVKWTEAQTWAYVRAHNVPYNALHDQGYPSLGCAPCTRAIKPGEDVRAGRWWWENPDTKECGLHKS